jgi:hypothetical protein
MVQLMSSAFVKGAKPDGTPALPTSCIQLWSLVEGSVHHNLDEGGRFSTEL